jgi:hypothetical protein
MTARPDTLLTLIAPESLEETLVDLLLAAPELAVGFTTSCASGHGADVTLKSGSEQVQGRGRRVRIEIAVASSALAPLGRRLREALPDANLFFWRTPLVDCGRLE